ncbi:MAG TPA: YlxR family protein [Firmicutes bacterium]|jgi:predicted RNA-binding protein YlxR (DUF448 family)|nr:YlxR family protein [Bacillota bacterium]HOQ23803.1 YlxR family protein [Bacillota bacterium]HPT66565.1 YlxR family protein [Bacillota bacterium]
MKVKKVPQRTCIGCRSVRGKKELLRIVRTPEGQVLFDPTGKKSGRGTYICPSVDCLEKALKGDCLAKNLEVTITQEMKEQLRAEVNRIVDRSL